MFFIKNPSQPSYIEGDDFEAYWNHMATAGGSDNVIERFAMPGQAQKQEWAQQMVAQQYQNQWNSESSKIQRGKEAGINPHIMAAGISGAGNTSPVSTPPAADSAAANSVGSVAQLGQAASGALDSTMNAYEKLALTGVERDAKKAEARKLLSEALHNDWLAYAISEMLPEQKANERADTYLKLANFDNAREEKKAIQKKVDEMQANIDKMKEQEALYRKQGNFVEAEKLRTEAVTAGVELDNYQKEEDKKWREKYRYNPNNPVDVTLMNAAVDDNDKVVDAIGKSIESSSYHERKGYNMAEIEDAYKKAFEEAKANADVAAMFKEFNVDVDTWSQIFVDMWHAATENPDDIKGAAAKMINLFLTMLSNFQASANYEGSPSGNRIGSHDKPKAGSRYGK